MLSNAALLTKDESYNALVQSAFVIQALQKPELLFTEIKDSSSEKYGRKKIVVDIFSEEIIRIIEAERKKIKEVLLTEVTVDVKKGSERTKEIQFNLEALIKELYQNSDFALPIKDIKCPKPGDNNAKEVAGQVAEQVLDDIVARLKNKEMSLVKIMPIHGTFYYRVLRLLKKTEYDKVDKIYQSLTTYTKSTKEAIKKITGTVKPTQQLGVLSEINDIDECSILNSMTATKNMIADLTECKEEKFNLAHINSLCRGKVVGDKGPFNPNDRIVEGPSTHALRLRHVCELSKNLVTPELLREYELAYALYLTCAGYHSFQEVLFVAMIIDPAENFDLIGYYLSLMSIDSFNKLSPDKPKGPCLIKREDGTYQIWGCKEDKWQQTDLGKLKLDELKMEWKEGQSVPISPKHPIWEILKRGHTHLFNMTTYGSGIPKSIKSNFDQMFQSVKSSIDVLINAQKELRKLQKSNAKEGLQKFGMTAQGQQQPTDQHQKDEQATAMLEGAKSKI